MVSAPNKMSVVCLQAAAERMIEKEAREAIAQKLKWGEKVGGFTLDDLIHCEMDSIEGYGRSISTVSEILCSDYPDTPLLQERFLSGLIERFLDSKPHVIEDEMQMIEEAA